ncbi:MAG: hypothetical protein AMXMBFR84_49810 [Candidatus Hydrogenedentota bacterium]
MGLFWAKLGMVDKVQCRSDEAAPRGNPAQGGTPDADDNSIRNSTIADQQPDSPGVLFERNPAPMWICDPETLTALAVNAAALQRYACGRDAFLKLTPQDFFPADDRRSIAQFIRHLRETVETSAVYSIKNLSDQTMDVEICMQTANFNGRPARWVMVIDSSLPIGSSRDSDIAGSNLASALETVREVVWSFDLAGGLSYLSPAAEWLYGRPLDALRSEPQFWIDAVHPDDRPYVDAALAELNEKGEKELVYRIIRGDGSIVWVHDRGWTIRNDRGEPIRHAGIVRDITEKHHTEVRLWLLAEAMEQVAESVVITDRSGVIQYVNPAFTSNSGYEASEVIGQNPRILKSGEQSPAVYESMWRTISSGGVWTGHLINKRKDGSLYTEEVSISPIRNDRSEIDHYVAVKRNITHELELEAQFLQAQKMEAVGRLAGGVAHDFNNLLGVIVGYSDLIDAELPDESPLKEEIGCIRDAAYRSRDITRQLLAFSRKQIILPEPLNLNEHIAVTQKTLMRLIGEDIELKFKPYPDLWTVYFDASQLDQVLLNLAVNARDAMPQGGAITVVTSNQTLTEADAESIPLAAAGDYVSLVFSDNGSGIDADVLDHIFEPFFTTKEAGKGTGLGLATVYGIVTQCKGFILVESQLGSGTSFQISLPRHTKGSIAHTKHTEAPPATGSGVVLIADDNPLVRKMAKSMLTRLGYTAYDGESPEELLHFSSTHEGKIDLLLTDVVMPGMSGKELADRLQAQRPDLRVIFMSGYTSDTIALHGVLQDGIHHLQKPFTQKDLTKKIHELLGVD